MQTLLSVPSTLVSHFDGLSDHFEDEMLVTNDPSGTKLGSGGGTSHLVLRHGRPRMVIDRLRIGQNQGNG